MEANAAFGWPARDVVLDSVASKYANTAIVHMNGEAYGKLAVTVAKHLAVAIIEVKQIRRLIELFLCDAKRVRLLSLNHHRLFHTASVPAIAPLQPRPELAMPPYMIHYGLSSPFLAIR